MVEHQQRRRKVTNRILYCTVERAPVRFRSTFDALHEPHPFVKPHFHFPMPRGSASGESSGWSLTDELRIATCRQKQSRPATTQAGLVKWLAETHGIKVTQATDSNTLKRSNELLRLDDTSDNLIVKRHRSVAFPLLEAALYQWTTECENQVNMSGDLIKEKATEFFPRLYPDASAIEFSNGWLQKFKHRHNIP